MNRISRTLNQLHDLRASRVDANDALRLIESVARPGESATEDNSAEDIADQEQRLAARFLVALKS